jgi:fused signal recognition particle receptor
MFSAIRKRLGLLRKEKSAEPLGEEGKRIDEKKLDQICWDLEIALLESDVAQPVADEIINRLKNDLKDKRIAKGFDLAEAVEASLKKSVASLLEKYTANFYEELLKKKRPAAVMFVGINGTGKTTVVAKIAHLLKEKGHSVVIAACDTFRAGAIEQLKVHGERLDIRVISHEHGGDAAAVAYDAIEHAKARHREFVLIDTAGRMQTNSNLMEEMKKIKRVAQPDIIVFVGDALAGNDAIEQARAFNEAVGIDMVVLTKVDADARGGAALSIAHAVGKPIAFLGTGQGYGDLIQFDPNWMAERLVSASPPEP